MKRIFTVCFLAILFFSCKNSNTQNKPVTVEEFLKLYQPLNLPVSFADSSLDNIGDTITINPSVLTQFIPGSAVHQALSDSASKFIIRPAGIIHFKTTDYLITKFITGKTIKLIVFVLNDKHQYKTSLLLLSNDNKNEYTYSVSITNEPTFIIRKQKFGDNKEVLYTRNGYSYDESSNTFTVVMNDSNEKKTTDVINPIDTFSALNKYSGDYITDKKNFISVRDGKNTHTYIFFIHFEKNKGKCIGELKGEMNVTGESNAVYQESGDPCVINFKFTASAIKVKEDGNCGNYRGITCPFDFTFKKKKEKSKDK